MAGSRPSTPLNTTAASLLGLLHQGPSSGWDLMATAESEIGAFWTLTRSQVYRELKTLSERGLIDAGPAGARDRRPYSLTDAGRAAFQEWLATDPGPEVIRYPLLLRLRFGRFLAPEAVAGMLDEARVRHAAVREQYLAERDAAERARAQGVEIPGVDDFTLAVLDLGIRYEQSVIDWIDDLPRHLVEGRPGPEAEPSP
ncbi:PadR family transcriptional regulator [Brachybacterium phenoliresistens]|uniref:PadR family transcriptional regulator n=1 Tax=Brachybacterium phenoliresistens TaxID=396014 RepID=UPI0031DC95F0